MNADAIQRRMDTGAPGDAKRCRLLGLGLVLGATLLCLVPRAHAQANECLVAFRGLSGAEKGGKVVCRDCDTCDRDGVKDNKCTFQFDICLNQGDASCTATTLKTVKAKGKGLTGPLPLPVDSACHTFTATVPLKKNGRKKGTTTITAQAVSSGKPTRHDVDKLILLCNPQPATCASTTPTTTTLPPCGNGVIDPGEQCDPAASSSGCPSGQGCNTQCQCVQVSCDPIVPGEPIANTYQLSGVVGPKLCTARATTNQFGACATDADCGGRTGTCLQTPWVTADGIAFPFPLGITTTFTVGAADVPPTCEHAACLGCGNPNAPCAGTPGCAGNPQCVTTTCCDQPSFVVPNFLLPGLGLCVRVDQVACGVGVINSSNPQTGDNEVVKMADTSDPGPDCTYGTGDDPAAKPCDTSAGGAGSDTKGKVVRTIGNGTPDGNGIQYRFGVRILATSWTDNQGCPPGATFDADESLITQLVLNAELSTAGATAGFTDLNGDGCALAGAGFTGAGPVTIAPPSVQPVPYAGGISQAAAAGVALSGSGPLNDLGFVAIVPNGAPTIVTPPQSCTCTPAPGCPE